MVESNDNNAIAPEGHPIWVLMEEHKIISKTAKRLVEIANSLAEMKSFSEAVEQVEEIEKIAHTFKHSIKHYEREENVIFPYLEKHGITQPPKMMWIEHDMIRSQEKNLFALIESKDKTTFLAFKERLAEVAEKLSELIDSHFYKENNILFPAALNTFTEEEWVETLQQFTQIGYCCFTPETAVQQSETSEAESSESDDDSIKFKTGGVTPEQLEAILNTLPFEITFVDANDEVKYFSHPAEMIFTRTTANIGRKVQLCHPQKSVHLVNQMLDDFRSGKKDFVEFWLPIKDKFVYIRYFAVRNPQGEYLGCMEVTQNITRIKELKGEKRLLD